MRARRLNKLAPRAHARRRPPACAAFLADAADGLSCQWLGRVQSGRQATPALAQVSLKLWPGVRLTCSTTCKCIRRITSAPCALCVSMCQRWAPIASTRKLFTNSRWGGGEGWSAPDNEWNGRHPDAYLIGTSRLIIYWRTAKECCRRKWIGHVGEMSRIPRF